MLTYGIVKEGKEPESDLNGNVLLPRFKCVTKPYRPTNRNHQHVSETIKYDIVQMMHVSGHKTQKDFPRDYISSACRLLSKKLSSEEIADEIATRTKKDSEIW